ALKAVAIALALGALWGFTIGHGQFTSVLQRVTVLQHNTNAGLSGRQTIWREVHAYLDAKPSRIYVGGGLDDFRGFVGTTTQLENAFSAHNVVYDLLTNGGIVMLAAFIVLLAVFARTA